MLLRAIIIDDEKKGIDTIKILVDKFIPGVKIIAESTLASIGIEMIENYKPDIVFLDINMPEMSGFEMLEKLNWKNFNLVFITAHQEYALRALKNNAVDYLLKPIDHQDLMATVQRIREKLQAVNDESVHPFNYTQLLGSLNEQSKNKIIINSKKVIESIDPREIVVLESLSNYTRIYLADTREIVISKTLGGFESLLCKKELHFMRIHHSYIVNLNKVTRYIKSSDNVVMNNDQKIPISKSKKEEFVRWLGL